MNPALSEKLEYKTRPLYDANLDHALRQRAYERSTGDMSNDPTRVHIALEKAVKAEMGPLWVGLIVVELSDMGEATCKVYNGDAEQEETMVANFTHTRTATR